MVWLRVAGHIHSTITTSALLLRFSGSHQWPKQAAFPWSHYLLYFFFPASACSAFGIALLASAGSCPQTASLSSQHHAVPCPFDYRELSAVGVSESEGSRHCIVGRKGPKMQQKGERARRRVLWAFPCGLVTVTVGEVPVESASFQCRSSVPGLLPRLVARGAGGPGEETDAPSHTLPRREALPGPYSLRGSLMLCTLVWVQLLVN